MLRFRPALFFLRRPSFDTLFKNMVERQHNKLKALGEGKATLKEKRLAYLRDVLGISAANPHFQLHKVPHVFRGATHNGMMQYERGAGFVQTVNPMMLEVDTENNRGGLKRLKIRVLKVSSKKEKQ